MHFETHFYCVKNGIRDDDAETLEAQLVTAAGAFSEDCRMWVPSDATPTIIGPSKVVGRCGKYRIQLLADVAGRDYIAQFYQEGASTALIAEHVWGGYATNLTEVAKELRRRVHWYFSKMASAFCDEG